MNREPEVAIDEVLVRVHAAGLATRRDPAHADAGSVEVRDVAGTVARFGGGDGEGRFVVGEEVFGTAAEGRSAAAGYVAVPATSLSSRPRTASFEESAALPSAAVAAWNVLVELAGVEPGHTVLVHHGAMTVGLYAIQLAAAVGATVVAVDAGESASLLRDVGADAVVDRDQAGRLFADVVVDPLSVASILSARPVFDAPATATHRLHPWRPTGVARPFARGFEIDRPEPQLALIADLVDNGGLRPIVDRCFPLAQADAARRHALTSATPGSTVLVVR